MKSTPTPPSLCPQCGYKVDHAAMTQGQHAKPKPGNLSVCIQCGSVSKFDSDMRMAELTAEEKARVESDPALVAHLGRLRLAVAFAQARYPRKPETRN